MKFSNQSNSSFYQNNTNSTNIKTDVVQNTTKKNLNICKKTTIQRRIKKEKRTLLLINFICKQQLRNKITFETMIKVCNKINNRYEESKTITNKLIEELNTTPLKKDFLPKLIKSLNCVNAKLNKSRYLVSTLTNLDNTKSNILHEIKIGDYP